MAKELLNLLMEDISPRPSADQFQNYKLTEGIQRELYFITVHITILSGIAFEN